MPQHGGHPFGGNVQAFLDGIQNALVGLMDKKAIDLIGWDPGSEEGFLNHFRHCLNRKLINLAPIHANRLTVVLPHL
jgi:hypothetical protein